MLLATRAAVPPPPARSLFSNTFASAKMLHQRGETPAQAAVPFPPAGARPCTGAGNSRQHSCMGAQLVLPDDR